MSLSEKFSQLNNGSGSSYTSNKRTVVRQNKTNVVFRQGGNRQNQQRGMKPPQSSYRKKGRVGGSNGNGKRRNSDNFNKKRKNPNKPKKEKKDHPELDQELKNFMSGESVKPKDVGDLQSVQ
jgi:hypothetical protein